MTVIYDEQAAGATKTVMTDAEITRLFRAVGFGVRYGMRSNTTEILKATGYMLALVALGFFFGRLSVCTNPQQANFTTPAVLAGQAPKQSRWPAKTEEVPSQTLQASRPTKITSNPAEGVPPPPAPWEPLYPRDDPFCVATNATTPDGRVQLEVTLTRAAKNVHGSLPVVVCCRHIACYELACEVTSQSGLAVDKYTIEYNATKCPIEWAAPAATRLVRTGPQEAKHLSDLCESYTPVCVKPGAYTLHAVIVKPTVGERLGAWVDANFEYAAPLTKMLQRYTLDDIEMMFHGMVLLCVMTVFVSSIVINIPDIWQRID